jgi:phosphoribosylformylglycinamidine synthase
MSEACLKFDTPVTGGNVSFYNQNPDGAVYPTPTIGMVGLLDNVNDKMTMDFKYAGDQLFLIGKSRPDINSSEYLHKIKMVRSCTGTDHFYAISQTVYISSGAYLY